MREVFYIEEVEQARTLLTPRRIELLRRLEQPRTCPELAEFFGETSQKVYYHVKALERAGLIEKVAERRVRGANEGSYRAVARSYWLAPHLVGQLGDRRAARDGASLANLLALAAEVQDDVGRLARRVGRETPSLGLAAQVNLPDGERRAAFLRDVQRLVTDLAREYGATGDESGEGEIFRLVLACYPQDTGTPTGEG